MTGIEGEAGTPDTPVIELRRVALTYPGPPPCTPSGPATSPSAGATS